MSTGPSRERGPAEEIIVKRLRPLNKKIQRFKNYASQPADTLNADQRAALASLPALEAVSHELEELMKHMEEAELVAAAKNREVRESLEREFDERLSTRVREHHTATASKIGHFLSLHSLLHPARSNDHANLTFAPLTLPMRLQDEVLATDILRVGRMYDDLLAGGDAAYTVLDALASGAKDVDDEDDRVHHLLVLLASSDPEPEKDVETESTFVEAAESHRDDASSEFTAEGTGSVVNGFDPQRTPVMPLREFSDAAPAFGSGSGSITRGAPLNFLQEDELAPKDEAEIVTQEYEVIEPMSAVMSQAAESAQMTPSATQTQTQTQTLDWAADDEATEEETAARLEKALSPKGALTPSAPAAETAASSPRAGTPKGQRKRRPQKKDGKEKEAREGEVKEAKPVKEGKESKGDKEAKDGKEAHKRKDGPPKEKKERTPRNDKSAKPAAITVDDDGFEVKTSRRPAEKGPGTRGRGAPRGRGRGGAPREGRDEARPNGTASGNGNGNGNSAPGNGINGKENTPRKPNGTANGKPKDDATPKPKPSIYKTTQPTGPSSAPIF